MRASFVWGRTCTGEAVAAKILDEPPQGGRVRKYVAGSRRGQAPRVCAALPLPGAVAASWCSRVNRRVERVERRAELTKPPLGRSRRGGARGRDEGRQRRDRSGQGSSSNCAGGRHLVMRRRESSTSSVHRRPVMAEAGERESVCEAPRTQAARTAACDPGSRHHSDEGAWSDAVHARPGGW